MLVSSLLITAAATVASTANASPILTPAAGEPSTQRRNTAAPRSFPLVQRRSPATRRGDDLVQWANHHRHELHAKYNLETPEKTRRAVGASDLVNFQDDSTWYTVADVGTPASAVNMVLDTGSADIWISPTTYKPASSSTFKNESSPFSITYGSGQVAGYLASETFALANHTITGQTFAVADQISSDLLDGTTSGIMGLGFQSLSTSKAQPIWSSAGETEFAFYLKRAESSATTTTSSGGSGGEGPIPGFKRQSSTSDQTSPGGYFTLGGTNSSLYQGDINWSNVITKGYWLITLGGITVADNAIDIGDTNKAAIDTGTTLIGGPDSVVQALYAQIPGSAQMSGADGYYQYPCDANVNATMTFGTQKYSLNSQDFKVAQTDTSGENCMGSFFALGTSSSSTLQWVVGGAFLKSVYSVFRDGDTAQVGFAALASGLETVGTTSVTVPKTAQASSAAAGATAQSVSIVAVALLAAFTLLL